MIGKIFRIGLLWICAIIVIPGDSLAASTTYNCLDKGYVCFSKSNFKDSIAVYRPKSKAIEVYFLESVITIDEKRSYAKNFKSVGNVGGKIEIEFEDVALGKFKEFEVAVNAEKTWKNANGVKGIYIKAKQKPTDADFSVKLQGIIVDGGVIKISTTGRKKSSHYPIDVEWDLDVTTTLILEE